MHMVNLGWPCRSAISRQQASALGLRQQIVLQSSASRGPSLADFAVPPRSSATLPVEGPRSPRRDAARTEKSFRA